MRKKITMWENMKVKYETEKYQKYQKLPKHVGYKRNNWDSKKENKGLRM